MRQKLSGLALTTIVSREKPLSPPLLCQARNSNPGKTLAFDLSQ